MRIKIFIFYWLLIIIPAMVIGSFAFRLLRHEHERLRLDALATLESRARTAAQSVELAVVEVTDNLRDQLRHLLPATRELELRRWQRDNPLIRNVFVWHSEDGLRIPPPQHPGNREEELFIHLYQRLFTGETAWRQVTLGLADTAEAAPSPLAAPGLADMPEEEPLPDLDSSLAPEPSADIYTRQQMARRELWEVSRRPPPSAAAPPPLPMEGLAQEEPMVFEAAEIDADKPAGIPGDVAGEVARARRALPPGRDHRDADFMLGRAEALAEAPVVGEERLRPAFPAAADEGGCIPWFSENTLHLLVWQRQDSETIAGIEVETTALLARLAGLLPDHRDNAAVFALLDGRDQVVHQTVGGNGGEYNELQTLLRVPAGVYLPNWQVAVRAGRGAELSEAGSFLALALVMAAILVAAIVSGGSLLLWQACHNMRDAQRKTSFVSNVSHELKTPLTSIRMFAELLADGRVAEKERRGQYLGIIARESQRLTRLVNNVLNFGRLEQGKKEYRRDWLDLPTMMERIVRDQEERLQSVGITVTREFADAFPRTHLDPDALEQVILNIIDNTLKYGADGGRLHICGRIDRRGRALVEFRDWGPGIPKRERKRIFQKFYRLDDSLSAEQPGSGLGLSIARQIMRDLGGDLECRAAPGGKGICFVLSLPVVQA